MLERVLSPFGFARSCYCPRTGSWKNSFFQFPACLSSTIAYCFSSATSFDASCMSYWICNKLSCNILIAQTLELELQSDAFCVSYVPDTSLLLYLSSFRISFFAEHVNLHFYSSILDFLITNIFSTSSNSRQGVHIIHICTEMAPVASVGPLASYVTGLSSALQKKGHLVEVILPK